MKYQPPSRLYSFTFSSWAVTFWVVMFLGALHGLIKKGPIMLYQKRDVWEKSGNLGLQHWIILALIIVFFSYCEGYRGFQMSWSPMLVKRAYQLSVVSIPVYNWTDIIYIDRFIDLMFSPMLAGGFICGTRRRLMLSWGITIFVFVFVLLMRFMSDDLPWKCFIDIGVVIGLSWGLLFILIWWLKIGVLNTWPHWIPDEYPSNLMIRNTGNIPLKTRRRSSSAEDNENLLQEVVSIHY